ncbi:MAG: hypothetical protein ACLR8Y_05385 [Alistipes indistinctus]
MMNRELGLLDVLGALERAESDKHIDGIYLNLSPVMPLGMATMEELRDALVKFKERSGKFVVAYSDFYTQRYLLPQFSGRPSLPQSPGNFAVEGAFVERDVL